jgi:hypothetical protein
MGKTNDALMRATDGKTPFLLFYYSVGDSCGVVVPNIHPAALPLLHPFTTINQRCILIYPTIDNHHLLRVRRNRVKEDNGVA